MEAISTSGLYNTVQNSAWQVQAKLATATTQESSGLIGSTYGDYGSTSKTILNLQSEISNAQTWSDQASTASDRVQTMYSSVGNMITELTSFRSEVSSAVSSTNSSLGTTASGVLDDLASQMNVKLSGRYLFSGSSTDTAPVDLTGYPASTPSADTADTSYYKGDSSTLSVKVGAQQSISYGVSGNAANSAFEEALRAVAMVQANPTDSTNLQSAYDLAGKALTALSEVQSSLSVSSNRLSQVKTQQSDYISTTENVLSNIKDVDTASASANVTELKTQLEASYSAISSVFKVKLTDYL